MARPSCVSLPKLKVRVRTIRDARVTKSLVADELKVLQGHKKGLNRFHLVKVYMHWRHHDDIFGELPQLANHQPSRELGYRPLFLFEWVGSLALQFIVGDSSFLCREVAQLTMQGKQLY